MGLTSALHAASSGLTAQGQRSAVVSDNIANASTPGYVRTDSVARSLVLGGYGVGVTMDDVRAEAGQGLLRDLRQALSDREGAAAEAGALARLTAVHGDPNEERSLAAKIQELESAVQGAAASPGSQTALRTVVDAAHSVTQTFAAVSDSIAAERTDAEAAIAQRVTALQDTLGQISTLNEQISTMANGGRDPSDLLDERDRLVNAVAEDVPIRTYEREMGDLVIMTKGGATLLDGRVAQISFTALPTLSPDLTYPASSPPISGLLIDGVDIAPASGAAGALDSGRLAGLFEVRDSWGPHFQEQIDGLAAHLADAFEAADLSVPGAGVTGLFVDAASPANGIDPATVTPGLAGRLMVNPIVDPAAGGDVTKLRDGLHGPVTATGDPTQLMQFLDAFAAPQPFDPALSLGTDRTLGAAAGAFIAGQQAERTGREADMETASITLGTYETALANRTGVNLDLQLKTLQDIETAYGANAQVLQVINRMYDALLAIV